MADASINFDVKIDSKNFKKGLEMMDSEFERMRSSIIKASAGIDTLFGDVNQKKSLQYAKTLAVQVEQAEKAAVKVKDLSKAYDKLMSGEEQPKSLENMNKELDKVNKATEKEIENNKKLKAQYEEIEKTVTMLSRRDTRNNRAALEEFKASNPDLTVDLDESTKSIEAGINMAAKLQKEIEEITLNPLLSKEFKGLATDLEKAKNEFSRLNMNAKITESAMNSVSEASKKSAEEFKLANDPSGMLRLNTELKNKLDMIEQEVDLTRSLEAQKKSALYNGPQGSSLADLENSLNDYDSKIKSSMQVTSELREEADQLGQAIGRIELSSLEINKITEMNNELRQTNDLIDSSVRLSEELRNKRVEIEDVLASGAEIMPNGDNAKFALIEIDNSLKSVDDTLQKNINKSTELNNALGTMAVSPTAPRAMSEVADKLEDASKSAGLVSNSITILGRVINKSFRAKTIDRWSSSMNRASRSSRSTAAGVKGIGKSARGTLGPLEGMANRITRMAKAMLFYNLIRGAFRGMSEYIGDLVDANENLKGSLDLIKYNMQVSFQSIWTVITPALEKMVHWLGVATTYMSKFIASITGIEYDASAKAVKDMADKKAALKDQEKGYKKVGKEAKKAGKAIQGFDQLNRLQEKDTGSSSDTDNRGNRKTSPFVAPLLPDTTAFEKSIGRMKAALSTLGDKFKYFYDNYGLKKFIEGVKAGFKEVDVERLKKNLAQVAKNKKDIFDETRESAEKLAKATGEALGTKVGTAIAVKGQIVTAMSDGYVDYSNNMKDEIIRWTNEVNGKMQRGMENITKETETKGKVWLRVVEKNKEGIAKVTEELLTNARKTSNLAGTVLADIFEVSTEKNLEFIEDNEVEYEKAVENMTEIMVESGNSVNTIWQSVIKTLDEAWDKQGRKAIANHGDRKNMVNKTNLENYNEYTAPSQRIAQSYLPETYESSVKESLKDLLELVAISEELYDNIFKKLYPAFEGFKTLKAKIDSTNRETTAAFDSQVVKVIMFFVDGFIAKMKLILIFLDLVFVKEWKKTWGLLKEIFADVMEGVGLGFDEKINSFKEGLKKFVDFSKRTLDPLGLFFKEEERKFTSWGPNLQRTMTTNVVNSGTSKSIPMLAKGGLIPPRNPRQVIVGDNMSENEIVSPVSTMQKAFTDAMMEMGGFGGSDNSETNALLRQLIGKVEAGHSIVMDKRVLGKAVVNSIRGVREQTGNRLI